MNVALNKFPDNYLLALKELVIASTMDLSPRLKDAVKEPAYRDDMVRALEKIHEHRLDCKPAAVPKGG